MPSSGQGAGPVKATCPKCQTQIVVSLGHNVCPRCGAKLLASRAEHRAAGNPFARGPVPPRDPANMNVKDRADLGGRAGGSSPQHARSASSAPSHSNSKSTAPKAALILAGWSIALGIFLVAAGLFGLVFVGLGYFLEFPWGGSSQYEFTLGSFLPCGIYVVIGGSLCGLGAAVLLPRRKR
jgi:hypothetical protein